MKPLDEEELLGFEIQLSEIQKYLDNFTEKHAKANFAAYKDFPKDGSFSGKLLCGFAKKKGELKLDGNPKWYCSMKFDFFYKLRSRSRKFFRKEYFFWCNFKYFFQHFFFTCKW